MVGSTYSLWFCCLRHSSASGPSRPGHRFARSTCSNNQQVSQVIQVSLVRPARHKTSQRYPPTTITRSVRSARAVCQSDRRDLERLSAGQSCKSGLYLSVNFRVTGSSFETVLLSKMLTIVSGSVAGPETILITHLASIYGQGIHLLRLFFYPRPGFRIRIFFAERGEGAGGKGKKWFFFFLSFFHVSDDS